jgi:hypothetical protein
MLLAALALLVHRLIRAFGAAARYRRLAGPRPAPARHLPGDRRGLQPPLCRRSTLGAVPIASRRTMDAVTELKLTLPDRLAREAREAGLLKPRAIKTLLREAIGRRAAAREFLSVADRVAAAGVPPMSEGEIQAEINAVRRARRRRAQARR